MIVPCLVVTGRGVYRGEVDLAQVQFLWFDGLRRWVNDPCPCPPGETEPLVDPKKEYRVAHLSMIHGGFASVVWDGEIVAAWERRRAEKNVTLYPERTP